MNEIRQLCTTSASPDKHLDEILALFHACPPQHLLPSLSLIGQSISCMTIEQLDINIIDHQLFLIIRQWSERLLQLWLINGTLNGDEYRAIFYIHQLFKLLSEWLIEQDNKINEELIKEVMKNLFLEENFLATLCRVINQLINNENDDQQSIIISHVSDNDENQLQTQASDIQAEQADVLDVLYRCVNSLVILYTHPFFLNNSMIDKYLTPCLLNCLNTPLFIQFSAEFLRQNITSDKINIRTIFILFTCLDYCTLSNITSATLLLIPSIKQILHTWCEIAQNSNDDISLLIVRLIRFINKLALENKDAIIRENLCAFLLPHFEILCQTSNLINDMTSLLISLCSTIIGKRHLRHLDFVQHILHGAKRYVQLWQPLALIITQYDLYQTSLFKRLVHLLIQRTINIFQSLTTASNDTSFDSTSPSSKNQIALAAIEWFVLFRTSFLSFTMIVNELINSTKKVNFINMLIDTILSLQQDDDISPKLIDIMIEILWTFSFSTSTNIHDNLQKHVDLCRWLKTNVHDSIPNIRLVSQAILFTLDSNTKIPIRTTFNRRPSIPTNILICLFNADETHHELCMAIADRLHTEQYSVELVLTPTCQSIDSLLNLINRFSLCLFCASTRMKYDNLSHFIYHYLSIQSSKIPLLTILIEQVCEIDGNWIENMPIIDIQSIHKEIQRYLNHNNDPHLRLPNRTNGMTSSIRNPPNQLYNYIQRPVSHWTTDDVSQWCEATQGNFETLRPLVMRLNGPALIHLAEILAIEPASMYYSLNDELLQRTGTSVPLTEYVSLRSELQRLIPPKQNEHMTMSTMQNNLKKKKWKNSRFCTLF